MTDNEFIKAIEEYEKFAHSAEFSKLDICAIYKKVKPILTGILPFLKLIPKFGSIIAAAITELMNVLDKTCPGT